MERLRESGVCVKWTPYGYGFIQPDLVTGRQSADVFCSYHSLEAIDGVRPRALIEGQAVSFEMGRDRDGRVCARSVRVEAD